MTSQSAFLPQRSWRWTVCVSGWPARSRFGSKCRRSAACSKRLGRCAPVIGAIDVSLSRLNCRRTRFRSGSMQRFRHRSVCVPRPLSSRKSSGSWGRAPFRSNRVPGFRVPMFTVRGTLALERWNLGTLERWNLNMSPETLEFEEPIVALVTEIEALDQLPATDARNRQIEMLRRKLETARAELYASLTPWQRVLVAR